jgi:carbon-monoxide dehydrogenase iron sulfur subunit
MVPLICRKCAPAPCVEACPVEALSQDEETGLITVDEDRCIGCDRCAESCEFGAITTHPITKVAIVCDECGGDPLCVKYCMPEALAFLTPEEYRMLKGRESAVRDDSLEWLEGPSSR